MLTNEIRDLLRELPTIIYGAWGQFVMSQDAICNSNAMIIFAKCGSLVNYTRPVRISYIGINDDPESFVFKLIINISSAAKNRCSIA
jgi:hypothetical protein